MFSNLLGFNRIIRTFSSLSIIFFRLFHLFETKALILGWRRRMSESVKARKADFTILTVREVAEYLRMSEAKVYRLANERHLPAMRIGKSWRFRKDLLDEWLSQCTESGLKAESGETQAGIKLTGMTTKSEMG
jgi:excisionase family DNA binding protein